MKVAIKFCGGCDPTYDRMEFFQRIRSLAGDAIEWVRVDDLKLEAVLLVCGCPTACPEDDLQHVSRLITVRHDGLSPEYVVAQLLARGQSDANQDER
jgi:hypothetical protein